MLSNLINNENALYPVYPIQSADLPEAGITSPELDASFTRYPHPIPVYCKQDGADMYMYHEPDIDTFIDAVSYMKEPVIWDDLSTAQRARAWFIELCFQHGLEAIFV